MDGLLLALVYVVITLVTTVLTPGGGLSILITIGHLVATIWMLLYFMKRYGATQEAYPHSRAFGYGFAASLCSNVIIVAYALLHFNVIFPESIAKTMEDVLASIQQAGSSNTDAFAYMGQHLGLIIPVVLFVMYTIWSLIISAILASFAKKETLMFPEE